MRTLLYPRPRAALALGVALLSACASSPAHVAAMEPEGRVLVRLDPPRTIAFERAPGDTVRIAAVSSIVGHLRATHGDTSWIGASRVRTAGDDRPAAVAGWTTMVVAGQGVRVDSAPGDVVLGDRGAKTVGAIVTATVVLIVGLAFALFSGERS